MESATYQDWNSLVYLELDHIHCPAPEVRWNISFPCCPVNVPIDPRSDQDHNPSRALSTPVCQIEEVGKNGVHTYQRFNTNPFNHRPHQRCAIQRDAQWATSDRFRLQHYVRVPRVLTARSQCDAYCF